jgi:hypothetical protein
VLRDRRVLFLLVPALLGLVIYNVSFFRDRARRMDGGSAPVAAAPPSAPSAPSAPSRAETPAPGAPAATQPATASRPAPRTYEEALAWMTPPSTHAELASLHSWAPRDIFHNEGGIAALAVMPGPSPGAAVAAGAGATGSAGGAAAAELPRVDGLVKTPHGTYAIVNGRLTKIGTALSQHERVVRIGRSGVVLSTMGGDKVLPLAGEVTPPRGNWESKP